LVVVLVSFQKQDDIIMQYITIHIIQCMLEAES
jgi:hypothetical protein